jgi:trk system potassium uptake protein TrkA
MKIIIAGVGKLGEYLAKSLVKEEHDVTLVDLDFATNQNVINNEDLNYINGNALDANVLIEAGIRETDLLISVMDQDELNTICCLLGKKLGAKHTIARIRTPEFANSTEILKEDLGLSMDQLFDLSDLELAKKIFKTLEMPSLADFTLSDGTIDYAGYAAAMQAYEETYASAASIIMSESKSEFEAF